MKIIIVGPPGAGKGTQADFICKQLGIPKISTGDMLRASMAKGDNLAQEIKQYINAGLLVPEDMVLGMLKSRISEADCKDGFLLDGFPRTVVQAKALEDFGVDIDSVVQLQIEDEEIVRRLSGRRVHAPTGRTYHIDTNPPKVSGQDDLTGEPLSQRADDKPETVRDRLRVYHEQTEPVINWYQQTVRSRPEFVKVDATATIEEVNKMIMSGLRARL